MIEILLMGSIFMGYMFLAGAIMLVGIGLLLLTDVIFGTNYGRRVCRWLRDEN